MTELLTAAQMRAIEQAAIESGQVTGLELMERAGQGVVDAVFEEWPALAASPNRAVVLCGPGNNGGDGFVVARLLKERGWEVDVFLYGDPAKLPPDAKTNYERWAELGTVAPLNEISDASLDNAVLTFDAVFGTGLSRPIPKEVFNTLSFAAVPYNSKSPPRPPIVAIDIPTGVDADSGKFLLGPDNPDPDDYYSPSLTVTFGTAKLGHYLTPNAENAAVFDILARSGRAIVVKPIGVELAIRRAHLDWDIVELLDLDKKRHIDLLGQEAVALALLHLPKDGRAHKYSHGHALILSGGSGKTGAARLAARGALRIGAGLVTLGVPPSAQLEVASQITALMLTRVADAGALAALLQDTRINALCLGPGLGLDRARAYVPEVVRAKHAPYTVLDADALSAYADAPETLFAMLHENCVLTPHAGEFARLFPDIAAKLNAPAITGPAYSKVDATRDAAKRAGCTVLFKGPETVIADQAGSASINSAQHDRAAPWLATAGSGDVLAGFITGLLARGFSPMEAAETAAWLHVECARSFGPGLIAEDLPEELPKVFQSLNL